MISSQTAENNDRTPNCSKGVAARDWPTRGRTETPVMETGWKFVSFGKKTAGAPPADLQLHSRLC